MMHKSLILGFMFEICLYTTVRAAPITVQIETAVSGGEKPVINGTTNLPDSMELQVTISAAGGGYSAQGNATVTAGRFRAGPFSDGVNPLNSGHYVVEITSPAAQFEPPAAQNVIGNDGGGMRGPLVVYDPSGLGFGRQIKDTTEINID